MLIELLKFLVNKLSIKEELIELETEDLLKISLWKIYTEDNFKNIFLTHGTFSDKKILLGIAKYFANLGYTCWIMEWRNHGNSAKINKKFNLETISNFDIKTTFTYLIKKLYIKNLHCITHSGGGISLTIFLLRNIEYVKKIDTITMFNCQSFGAINSKKKYLKILASKYVSYLLGYVPGKKIGLGEHNEKYFTMKQWFNWNLKKEFKGKSGFDYLKNMRLITTPVLSICAEGDKFIAPKTGCEKFIRSFNNENNKLIVCSIKNGFEEDYNHSRTILSRNASKEIWKIALNWIETTKDNKKYT